MWKVFKAGIFSTQLTDLKYQPNKLINVTIIKHSIAWSINCIARTCWQYPIQKLLSCYNHVAPCQHLVADGQLHGCSNLVITMQFECCCQVVNTLTQPCTWWHYTTQPQPCEQVATMPQTTLSVLPLLQPCTQAVAVFYSTMQVPQI